MAAAYEKSGADPGTTPDGQYYQESDLAALRRVGAAPLIVQLADFALVLLLRFVQALLALDTLKLFALLARCLESTGRFGAIPILSLSGTPILSVQLLILLALPLLLLLLLLLALQLTLLFAFGLCRNSGGEQARACGQKGNRYSAYNIFHMNLRGCLL